MRIVGASASQSRWIVAECRRISRVRSISDAISNASATTNMTATTPPWAIPARRGEKGADQQRRGDHGAQHGEVDGAAQELHPAREGIGDRLPERRFEGGEIAGAQRPVSIDDPLHAGDKDRQKRGHGAKHERRRGRVRDRRAEVIDIADNRHSKSPRLGAIRTLAPPRDSGQRRDGEACGPRMRNCNSKPGAKRRSAAMRDLSVTPRRILRRARVNHVIAEARTLPARDRAI